MSQASKHVGWCLRKAQKEVEECEKQGKRIKHRGLLQVKSDIRKAEYHLEKASHNFKAITSFYEAGFSDWSITATFYTIYQCFLAIATKFGYESGNQECTISLIEWLNEENKIDIDKKYIELLKSEESKEKEGSLIDLREEYTYSIKTKVENKDKVDEMIILCKELMDITNEIIHK